MVKHLIVNADDFGFSAEVNAGVVAAHDRGIVTSASMMVRWSAAPAAAALAAQRPALALGLHLDLGEWEYTADRGWLSRHEVVDTADAHAVAAEVERQLATFVELTGRRPTHIDGHQHVHRHEPAADVVGALADAFGVPLRLADDRITYRGDFYGQGPRGEPYPAGITVAHLTGLVASLPDGWTELGCHPGIAVDPASSSYATEREFEVAVLCSPEVRHAIDHHGVQLRSFADL